MTQTVNQV